MFVKRLTLNQLKDEIMSRVIYNGQIIVDPEMAKGLLEKLPVYQRNHEDWRSDILMERMKNGEYHDSISDLTLLVYDGGEYLGNGQQSCEAIIKLGSPRELNLRKIQCENETEARQLFGAMDDPLSARTEDDIVKTNDLVKLLSTKDFTPTVQEVKKAIGAAMMAEYIGSGRAIPTIQKQTKLRTQSKYVAVGLRWKSEIIRIFTIIRNHDVADVGSRVLNMDFIACCMYILRHDPVDGEDFVVGITQSANDRERFPKGDPRLAVLKFFRNLKGKKGVDGWLKHGKWYVLMSRAWNAYKGYRAGKEPGCKGFGRLDTKKRHDLQFLGTPSWVDNRKRVK